MKNLSMHFNESEFICPCCGKYLIDNSLIYLLEAIREHFNKPVIINSGYRCELHNKNIGGAIDSKHLYGQAADIVVLGINAIDVYKYVDQINKKGGLGKYDGYTHVDVCIDPQNRRF